ncbi:hypothetical protein, partial [Staphylococcus shinii]|uniref:hypothetical protein n=1 Tax=Staphylococcus shinii TaxID=2912228 RepID=UPI003CFBAE29
MSDEAVAASGRTREQLIADARTQMIGTVGNAQTMRDDTVDAINDIEVRAENVDGKEITVKAKKSGFDTVMTAITNLLNIIPPNPISFA